MNFRQPLRGILLRGLNVPIRRGYPLGTVLPLWAIFGLLGLKLQKRARQTGLQTKSLEEIYKLNKHQLLGFSNSTLVGLLVAAAVLKY